MATKEDIYDDQISPLMTKIIQVCQENKIAMLADFDLSDEHEPDLLCITALASAEYNPPRGFIDAIDLLTRRSVTLAITSLRIDTDD